MRLCDGQPDGFERRLHSLRGDASRAPDLTDSILSQVGAHRPFADERSLRRKRWARIVGCAVAMGLSVCGGLVAMQWHQIAPGLAKPRPIAGIVRSAADDVRSSTQTLRAVPGQFAVMIRATPRTSTDDVVAVRAVANNVLVPMGGAIVSAPSSSLSDPRVELANRVLASGQQAFDRAGRLASSIRTFSPMGKGPDHGASGSFAERLERAVGGRGVVDVGPQ